jgi:hypothetical protein
MYVTSSIPFDDRSSRRCDPQWSYSIRSPKPWTEEMGSLEDRLSNIDIEHIDWLPPCGVYVFWCLLNILPLLLELLELLCINCLSRLAILQMNYTRKRMISTTRWPPSSALTNSRYRCPSCVRLLSVGNPIYSCALAHEMDRRLANVANTLKAPQAKMRWEETMLHM